MRKLRFEKYDENKHRCLISNWQNDFECATDNVKRFIDYGLLKDYNDMPTLLDVYADIPTSGEQTYKYVIFDENKDVGVAVLNWTKLNEKEKMLAIFHLIIRPKEQGKHYGTVIMDEIINNGENFIKHDYNEICASVNVSNYPCQAMMKKLGFKQECVGQEYIMYSLKERERCMYE